jgi:exopolyphosphatase/guanosine-5'-triphosphate,3'-diphosphate pyrophosphatase
MMVAVADQIVKMELRARDLAEVRAQLGREPTTPFTVVARCTGGHPLVIRNAPFDADGDPFPTTYWLTCPEAVKAVSRLEAGGWIGRWNERIAAEPDVAAGVAAAHAAAARERETLATGAGAWGGVAGTRTGVKCLHAHYAFHLAGGEDPIGSWVAGEIEPIHAGRRPGRLAAIDQGTNSCRLLVVEPDDAGTPTELARDMVITRLGRGVDRTGRIDEDALAGTIEVLARFCRRARALGAARIRVGATSAVRDAENREAFIRAVREHAGTDPEVIDGEHEAALSFLGGTFGLDADQAPGPYLVLDIGGGSTEFVVGREPGRADAAISTQMGSVRLTERSIESDPPSTEDLERVREEVARRMDQATAAVSIGEVRTFVSVAGTATTLQALALGLERYDPDRIHRSWLAREEVDRQLARLCSMTNGQRAALPVMAPGRGDVIVAGAVILSSVMERFGFERTLVSETDILDGLALEWLGVGG